MPRGMVTHGASKTLAYQSWCSMRARCRGTTARDRKYYTDRGIKVCERWEDSFSEFLADMGERAPGTTIDRIDNSGNYEPGNCRWADKFTQASNRPSAYKIPVGGDVCSLALASPKLGITEDAVSKVIRKRRVSAEDAIKIVLARKNPLDGRVGNCYGSINSQSKLTEMQVIEIRAKLSIGRSQQSVANDYGVSRSAISLIALNKTWHPDTMQVALRLAEDGG